MADRVSFRNLKMTMTHPDLYGIDFLMVLPSEFGHSTIFLDRCRQKHLLGILASSLFVCLLSLFV